MTTIQYIYFFLLYATIVSFICQRRQLSPVLTVLFTYFVIYAVFNTTGKVMQLMHVKNNLFLYRILTPVEYVFLAAVYYRSIENKNIKLAIMLSMAAFVLACILLSVFAETWTDNDSYARPLESLLITVWILVYCRQILTTNRILTMHLDPMFWVSMGFLTYFIGVLFIQGSLNQLIRVNKAMAGKLYSYQYLFEFNLFLQINIALFCHRIFKQHDQAALKPPGVYRT